MESIACADTKVSDDEQECKNEELTLQERFTNLESMHGGAIGDPAAFLKKQARLYVSKCARISDNKRSLFGSGASMRKKRRNNVSMLMRNAIAAAMKILMSPNNRELRVVSIQPSDFSEHVIKKIEKLEKLILASPARSKQETIMNVARSIKPYFDQAVAKQTKEHGVLFKGQSLNEDLFVRELLHLTL